MLIATPYENGEICQHFGRAPQFKLFDIAGGDISESVIVDTLGQGHEALAQFLAMHGIEVVIAGGIGHGAIVALAQSGINVVPGIQGDPDVAVKALITGQLMAGYADASAAREQSGCGCGCGGHDHEEGGCGCGCGSHDHEEGTCACGGHEGGCECGGECECSGHEEGNGGCGCCCGDH